MTIPKEIIRKKNDLFRKTFVDGTVMLTQGVRESDHLIEIINAVKAFDKFTPDNDPHLEHDFGKFTIQGEDYFWKIDYYDDNYEGFKEDGNRVMTIMMADGILKQPQTKRNLFTLDFYKEKTPY